MKKINLFGLTVTVGVIGILSIIISINSSLKLLESVKIALGLIYVLFLPGFIISYILFPTTKLEIIKEDNENKNKNSIDLIERIALSFALSIATVPLTIFYLSLIGVKINFLNSLITIFGIMIISLIIIGIRKIRKK